ncbi:MAG: hypothetical protein U0Q16_00080 [Bryobacteraceae bacterium]
MLFELRRACCLDADLFADSLDLRNPVLEHAHQLIPLFQPRGGRIAFALHPAQIHGAVIEQPLEPLLVDEVGAESVEPRSHLLEQGVHRLL